MVKTRIVKDVSGSVDLCETYSDEGKKLLQIETGITYDESVIDAIAGYNEDGSPYSRYHYEEINDTPDDEPMPDESAPEIVS